MFKLGGKEKELKARRMKSHKHEYDEDGECECGAKLNKPIVNTDTKAGPDDEHERGGKDDIKYPHERE